MARPGCPVAVRPHIPYSVPMSRKAQRRRPPARNTFRIIGGRWRGRRVAFPPLEAVRPSPDRVRETLFNWLAPLIEGARCLDLFAGSGALGIEALSRGAAQVVFVDRERRLTDALRARAGELGFDDRVVCLHADAFDYLARAGERFDVVFLDPPFGEGLVSPVLGRLPPRLAPFNRVYAESAAAPDPALPAGWASLRRKQAGAVVYRLLAFEEESP